MEKANKFMRKNKPLLCVFWLISAIISLIFSIYFHDIDRFVYLDFKISFYAQLILSAIYGFK